MEDDRPPPTLTCDHCHAPLAAAAVGSAFFRDEQLRDDEDIRLHALRSLYAGREALILHGVERARATGHDMGYRTADDLIADTWPDYTNEERRALYRYARLSARALLRRHWSRVERLAAAVLTQETLSGDEARTILAKEARPGADDGDTDGGD